MGLHPSIINVGVVMATAKRESPNTGSVRGAQLSKGLPGLKPPAGLFQTQERANSLFLICAAAMAYPPPEPSTKCR